eukprot:1140899-Pelagomonas_calceolata.AAC.1
MKNREGEAATVRAHQPPHLSTNTILPQQQEQQRVQQHQGRTGEELRGKDKLVPLPPSLSTLDGAGN